MMLTRVLTSLLLITALASCTATEAPKTTPPTGASPVASTSTVSPPDTDGVVARFTKDIWPALEGYRAPGQGSPSYRRYLTVVDPGLDGPAWNALFESGVALAKVHYNAETGAVESFPTGPLTLADASLTGLDVPTATLTICYTYTAVTQRTINDQSQAPAASEATIGLIKDNGTWYLHSITNDHVVQGCSASPKV